MDCKALLIFYVYLVSQYFKRQKLRRSFIIACGVGAEALANPEYFLCFDLFVLGDGEEVLRDFEGYSNDM